MDNSVEGMDFLERTCEELRFVASAGHGSDGRFANTSRIMTLWSGPLLEQCRRMLPNLVFARVEVSRNRTGSLDAGAGVQTCSWTCSFGGAGLIFDDEAGGQVDAQRTWTEVDLSRAHHLEVGSGDAAHIITVYAPAAMLAATVAAEQPEEAVPGTLLGFQRNQIWWLTRRSRMSSSLYMLGPLTPILPS